VSELYDFAKLISDLDEIDGWLEEMGFANHDRVRKYRSNIRRMMEVQESGGIADLQQTMPF
jgi:hypothetical protein